MPDVYALDLDEEFLSHLAIPESVEAIRAEKLNTVLLEDRGVIEVFEWQRQHVREHGKPATASVLADEFDLDLAEPLTAIGDLIERLRDRYMRNHVREHMEEISDAYKEDPSKVIEVLPRVSRELLSIAGQRGEQYGTGDFDRAMHKYDEAVLAGSGPSFGFDEVDHHFYGVKGVSFTIAPPKTYKSWIGINSLVKNVENDLRTMHYTLELPAHESDMRIRCLAAGVPFWKFLRGQLSLEDRDVLRETSELLDDLGVYSTEKPAAGHRSIEELVEHAMDWGAEYLIIDQLQYCETSKGKQLGSGDTGDYWGVLNKARDLSDHIPIHFMHQFNRTVMFAEKMPEMQQAKGSSAIEEVATLALGIWANKDMRRSNVIELGTLASRNYQYEAWEVGVELSKGCGFELIGRAVHDDE